jgi:murein DD-endopeptidase MepM/ murein hydrolase activator NlpD
VGRLLFFVLGVLVGAAVTWWLYWSGNVPLPAQSTVAAQVAPMSPASTTEPMPAPNAPELAQAQVPAPPASVGGAVPMLPTQPLAPPASPTDSEAVAPATAANASESTVPQTQDAVAAVTAANASGALLLPVQGVQASKLVDTFTQSRGAGRVHDAIDIMAARGTPVLAVADGRVAKLFTSKPGGLTVYQFDREEKLAYYYAHLDHYAPNLAEGQQLKRGEVLGYVGSTGNASPEAPHLHFAVFVLGPEKHWWQGTAVNPYPLLGGR